MSDVETTSRAAAPSSGATQPAGEEPTQTTPEESAADFLSPTDEPATSGRSRRPVLGPTLWTCGAVLWTYVILGQLVIEARFPEALAWMIVAGVFAGVWWRAHRTGSAWQIWGPGVLALLLFILEIGFISTMLGASSRRSAAALGVGLCVIGIGQFFVGRLLTSPPALDLHRNQRVAFVVVWVIVVGVTGATLVSMVA